MTIHNSSIIKKIECITNDHKLDSGILQDEELPRTIAKLCHYPTISLLP